MSKVQSPVAVSRERSDARSAVPVAMAGMFMAVLDTYIVVVAGPAIRADLHASADGLQWVLAGYQLSYAVFLVTAGRLADLLGHKRVFLAGVGLFVLASAGCGLAPGVGVLVAARLVQGLGAAMLVPQVFSLITLLVPGERRHRVFGVLGVVIGLATVGGQLVGGLLVGADVLGSGWRSVFWVNVPIGVVTLVLAARWVPESRAARTRRLDLAGVAVLSVALVLLVLPLIQGRQAGWPWWSWACLAGSAVAFGCFTAVERAVARRGGDPLVALALFGQRSFAVGLVLVVCVYSVLSSYYLALSVSVQDGLGLSAVGAGLVYAPAAVTFFVFGLVAGRLVPRYGRRVLEVGAVVLALGYLSTALVLAFGPALSPVVVIPTLVVQSAGGGLLITPLLNVVLSRVAPEVVGAASGALSTAQQVGAALGVALVGAVFFGAFDPGRGGAVRAAGHAFALASVTVCAIAAVVAALVFLLPRGSTADRR
jgi:EmrB/QacA subfamily drug resistance transporter